MSKQKKQTNAARKEKRKARREKVAARTAAHEIGAGAASPAPAAPASPEPSLTPRIDALTDGSICRLYLELGGDHLDAALDAARVTVDFYRMELEDRRRVLANPRASELERNRRLTISPTVGVRAIRAIADLLKKRAALREECRKEIEIIRIRESEQKPGSASSAGSGQAGSGQAELNQSPARKGGVDTEETLPETEPQSKAAPNATGSLDKYERLKAHAAATKA